VLRHTDARAATPLPRTRSPPARGPWSAVQSLPWARPRGRCG